MARFKTTKAAVKSAIKAMDKQGHPCLNAKGSCVYWDQGERCIVGHMVTEVVAKDIGPDSVSGLTLAFLKSCIAPDMTSQQRRGLQRLQSVHDNMALKIDRSGPFSALVKTELRMLDAHSERQAADLRSVL